MPTQPTFGSPDTVLLSDEDAAVQVLEGAILGLWDVVSQLTRLRRTSRTNYRVTIFGSARLEPETAAYADVKRLAAALTAMGCDIVTGGGPGLMRAANEGAASAGATAGGRSVGIRVDLPFEQETNPFVGVAYEHRTFFSRLHHFILVSDAFVVTPGGVGTLLELSLAWQLLQVDRLANVPLVLVGPMWRALVDWGRDFMLAPGHEIASADDFTVPRCVDGIEDAVSLLQSHREGWLRARVPAGGA